MVFKSKREFRNITNGNEPNHIQIPSSHYLGMREGQFPSMTYPAHYERFKRLMKK